MTNPLEALVDLLEAAIKDMPKEEQQKLTMQMLIDALGLLDKHIKQTCQLLDSLPYDSLREVLNKAFAEDEKKPLKLQLHLNNLDAAERMWETILKPHRATQAELARAYIHEATKPKTENMQ